MFKPGDRVECVRSDGRQRLTRGQVYVVSVAADWDGLIRVETVDGMFYSSRFAAARPKHDPFNQRVADWCANEL